MRLSRVPACGEYGSGRRAAALSQQLLFAYFGGGYAAGYYAYLWTQMLADDGYQWFVEQGGLTRENGSVSAKRFCLAAIALI